MNRFEKMFGTPELLLSYLDMVGAQDVADNICPLCVDYICTCDIDFDELYDMFGEEEGYKIGMKECRKWLCEWLKNDA